MEKIKVLRDISVTIIQVIDGKPHPHEVQIQLEIEVPVEPEYCHDEKNRGIELEYARRWVEHHLLVKVLHTPVSTVSK